MQKEWLLVKISYRFRKPYDDHNFFGFEGPKGFLVEILRNYEVGQNNKPFFVQWQGNILII